MSDLDVKAVRERLLSAEYPEAVHMGLELLDRVEALEQILNEMRRINTDLSRQLAVRDTR